MAQVRKPTAQRILIASANPLFGKGLERMLVRRRSGSTPEIRTARSMVDTLHQMEKWQPDLVIVDYNDQTIDRAEFLNRFVETNWPMQVMLISLQISGEVVVYDRKTLTQDQAVDWLSLLPATNHSRPS
jgi:cytochrome c oxidase subunit II